MVAECGHTNTLCSSFRIIYVKKNLHIDGFISEDSVSQLYSVKSTAPPSGIKRIAPARVRQSISFALSGKSSHMLMCSFDGL